MTRPFQYLSGDRAIVDAEAHLMATVNDGFDNADEIGTYICDAVNAYKGGPPVLLHALEHVSARLNNLLAESCITDAHLSEIGVLLSTVVEPALRKARGEEVD